MDSVTQYDLAARRMRDLPTTSATQQRLQRAVYQQATNFLHLHMLPLRTLPKLLKHATPNGSLNGNWHSNNSSQHTLTKRSTGTSSSLASIRYNDKADGGSQASMHMRWR